MEPLHLGLSYVYTLQVLLDLVRFGAQSWAQRPETTCTFGGAATLSGNTPPWVRTRLSPLPAGLEVGAFAAMA